MLSLLKKKCSHCGSKIDHFGFTPDDALGSLSLRNQPNSAELHHALMHRIGGKCPQCGEVCCSKCYHDRQYVCPHCGAKIPELGGHSARTTG